MQKQMQSSVDKAVNAMSQRTWVGPEQEPVAWQFMKGSSFRKRRPDDFDDLASDGLPYWKPLYTTPPQRTWVGLTDEEIQECLKGLPTQTIDVYAKRIEAKLNQKKGYAEEKNT